MLEDLRYAFRQFRKNPGFAALAITTLGLGIGAAAAMFGLIQGVLLAPPPYADPDHVVLVTPVRTDGQKYERGATVGQLVAWRGSRTVEEAASYRWTFNFLVRPDGSESLGGMVVSRNYFRVLGLKPILGRELTEAEAGRPGTPGNPGTPGTPPSAIIIGHDLWQRKFKGDPHVIGKTLILSRMPAPLPIVGVMPSGLRFLPDPGASSEPNYDLNARVDFWLSFSLDESRIKSGAGNVVGRLRAGVTAEQARAELAAITTGQGKSDADLAGLTAAVRPIREVLNQDARRLLVPLFGSVALVFLIACANVAGLLLTRGLQRQPEYALRAALGAGRPRLFRQVLTEGIALALISALVGAGLAVGIVAVLKAISGQAVPRSDAVAVGWPVFAFGVVAALAAAALASLLPALRASFSVGTHGLKGSRSTASLTERRLLGGVAALQIVLTVALLSGAALLIRTAYNLENVRPGYDTEHVLAMTVTAVQREKWVEFHTQALERVAALPGVARAAFAWGVPLTGNKWPGDMDLPAQPGSSRLVDCVSLPLRAITPDYFDVMGMRVVEGRGFRQSDDLQAPRVAVINTAMARRHFGTATPIGRQIRFSGDNERAIEIVGIEADTRTDSLHEPAGPEVYLPLWQSRAFSKHLVVRATGDPLALAALVRRELRAVDPTSAVEHVTTMAEIRRESTASQIFAMRLLAGFAVSATLLAVVGLYGVLSLSVGARTKEIAVRKAVGAEWPQIVRLVLGEGSRLIVVGLALGLAAALLVGRLLEALLFDVTPFDPLALSAAAVLFGVVAFLACALPVYRAGRVDLMEALRQE